MNIILNINVSIFSIFSIESEFWHYIGSVKISKWKWSGLSYFRGTCIVTSLLDMVIEETRVDDASFMLLFM